MSSNEIKKENKSKKQCLLVLSYKTYNPDHLIRSTKPKKTMKPRFLKIKCQKIKLKKNI
jgi:hypothetical protein